MATTFSFSFPFSKLPLPFSSAKVSTRTVPSPLTSTHLFSQQLGGFPLRPPAFSPIKPNATVSSSQLGDQFSDQRLQISSDNIRSQLPLRSWYPLLASLSFNQWMLNTKISHLILIDSPLFLSCSIWNWRGYSIRYQCSGDDGPALILIHGFGANRSTPFNFCFSYH